MASARHIRLLARPRFAVNVGLFTILLGIMIMPSESDAGRVSGISPNQYRQVTESDLSRLDPDYANLSQLLRSRSVLTRSTGKMLQIRQI